MSHKHTRLALATAFVFIGFAGVANAQFNLPGLTPADPSVLACASVNGQTVRCPIPANSTVVFFRQTSSAACVKGSSYVIGRDTVSVSNGCRAEFKLAELTQLSGAALTSALRSQIIPELAAQLRADYRLAAAPIVGLVNDDERFISSTDVGYSGQARVNLDGNTTKIIAFDSVYGTRSHEFSNLTYRVVKDAPPPPSPGSSDAVFSQHLRSKLAAAMQDKLANETGARNSSARFELINDQQRAISSNEINYSGKGRVMLDGNRWQPIEFDSTYDLRNDSIHNLTYRMVGNGTGDAPGGNGTSGSADWKPGVSMDENNQDALATAIATEVRNLKGGGNVQVVINLHYQEADVAGGRARYRGKFGYSYNDTNWVTRGFEASMSLTQNKVNDLRVFKLKGR